MIEIKNHKLSNIVNVSINLNDGIYVFKGKSGAGKTFVSSILSGICRDKGLTYRYFNNTAKNDTAEIISATASNKDIVFFDNADLYLTDEILENVKNTKCILISMKNHYKLKTEYKDCRVVYTKDNLRLEEYE